MQIVLHLVLRDESIYMYDFARKKVPKGAKHRVTEEELKPLRMMKTWFNQEVARATDHFHDGNTLYKLQKIQWRLEVNPEKLDVPVHNDSIDSAVFCAQCVKHLAAQRPLLFGRSNTERGTMHLRKLMALELACGRLMHEDKWGL